MLAHKLLKFAD